MPFSYQGKLASEEKKPASRSQSADTNLSNVVSSVDHLLQKKGNVVLSLDQHDTIGHAAQLLKDKDVGALVVASDEGALQGIISERDIVRRLAESSDGILELSIGEIMTRDVITCSPDDSMIKVLQIMTEGHFRHIPVVENGMLVGLVTIGDMVNFRLKELEYESLQMKQMIVG